MQSWRVVKTITQLTIQRKEQCLTLTMSPYKHYIKGINQISEWEHVNEAICFFLRISYYSTSCRLPTDTQCPINLAAGCRGARPGVVCVNWPCTGRLLRAAALSHCLVACSQTSLVLGTQAPLHHSHCLRPTHHQELRTCR